MTESRDLNIAAYLNMADQEFKEIYTPQKRHTSVEYLKEQVEELSEKLDEEIEQATEKEDYETASALTKLKKEMDVVEEETEGLTTDDETDNRYKLEDRKRKIAQEIDSATKNKRLQLAKEHYFETKEKCETIMDENGNDYERKVFNDIVAQEQTFLTTNSPIKIQEKSDELHSIIGQIRWRTPEFLKNSFEWLKGEQAKMNDKNAAKSLIDAGKFAIESQNWDRLKEINYGLLDQLPKTTRDQLNTKIGFGL